MVPNLCCSICGRACALFDVVDFNKSCAESWGTFLEFSGIPIYYAQCSYCGFCFAPEMMSWSPQRMREQVYNDQYLLVDPNYVEGRPKDIARNLVSMFGNRAHHIRHLDYGGGNGLLAQLLRDSNWQSESYDPLVDAHVAVERIGTFDLITAFEVFEHVADVPNLMRTLRSLLAANGVILFSTLLSDGYIVAKQRLNWWYASPRNGHISLFSQNSLAYLAEANHMSFASFSELVHVFYTNVPNWAAHLIRA